MISEIPLLTLKQAKSLAKVYNSKFFYFWQAKAKKDGIVETIIQQLCKRMFDDFAFAYQRKGFIMSFMQLDNGGAYSSGGKFRKKAEGTIKGASDVMIHIKNTKTNDVSQLMIEFKRIGNYKITPEQIQFQELYRVFGFHCEIINNPFYFESLMMECLKKLK